jgi:hypothetical protein
LPLSASCSTNPTPQDPVHRPFWQVQLACDLGDSEAPLAAGQQPEDRRGSLDRLDGRRHERTVSESCSAMSAIV